MTHVCSWWKGPRRLSAPPTTTPAPHSAPSMTLAWDQFPNSSLSRCLMISERERVAGHVCQLSAEPLRITPVALPIKAKFRALTTPWPHGFPSLSSLPQWASSTYKPNKHFPVSTTFAPEELEASGLWVQSWLGHAPAICAVTRPPLHLPPRAALRGPGTRGRGDQRAQLWR